MADKERYIAACGVPEIIVAGCNAPGRYVPVITVDEHRLTKLRPVGWLLSPAVFAAHLDFLLPYRRHVLLWVNRNIVSGASMPECLSLYDDEQTWQNAIERIENQSGPFDRDNVSSPLTQREKEVLKLIAGGFTAKEIADKLGISVNTVVTHRKNLSSKLGIRSASGLSLYAMMNGLI